MRSLRQIDISVTQMTVAGCTLFCWRDDEIQTVYKLKATAISRRGREFVVHGHSDSETALDAAVELLVVRAVFMASQHLEVENVKLQRLHSLAPAVEQ